jgi:hypothetical protein
MPRPEVRHQSPGERAARGKEARADVPRSSHAEFAPQPKRPDPVDLIEAQSQTRVPELVPIRYGCEQAWSRRRSPTQWQAPYPCGSADAAHGQAHRGTARRASGRRPKTGHAGCWCLPDGARHHRAPRGFGRFSCLPRRPSGTRGSCATGGQVPMWRSAHRVVLSGWRDLPCCVERAATMPVPRPFSWCSAGWGPSGDSSCRMSAATSHGGAARTRLSPDDL